MYGSPMKGKFLKSKRITFSAEILNNKKNVVPGPGTYEAPKVQKLLGIFKCNEEKGAFIENAKYVG